ncbi:YcnI family copper-binding membrane protein [Paracoccus jiaweipingae]|uniref:YcnI family copper-binding membrane protein n=1 Tax=unclassified Paracoccus (in: a-proteobacteria) TaxID=2688777 RepID=UPI0037AA2FE7
MKINIFAAALACLAVPAFGPAFAHATLEQPEAEAGTYYKAILRVPHGCDGQATKEVRITLPDGIYAVKPMPKAGWTLETVRGDYAKPYDNHGKIEAQGVREVIWRGELADDHYDEFVLRGKIGADVADGTVLAFPTVQTCDNGTAEWTQIAQPGQDRPDHPAPTVLIHAPHGHEGHSH